MPSQPAELTPALERQLDQLSLNKIFDYLFKRLDMRNAELRLRCRNGRYDSGRAVVPLGNPPR